jgi:putative flippase GtrA
MEKKTDKQGEPKVKLYRLTFRQRVKRKIEQFKMYCYTSFASAALMFLLLYVFTSLLGIHYLLSLVMVYVISITTSFILNKVYVFRLFNPTSLTKQYRHFFIIGIASFLANFIFLFILVDLVGLWYLLAQLIIASIGLPILFLSHEKFVFSHI